MCDSTRGRLSQTAAASRSLMAPLPTHSDHQRAIPTSGPLGSLCEWLLREGRVKVTLMGREARRLTTAACPCWRWSPSCRERRTWHHCAGATQQVCPTKTLAGQRGKWINKQFSSSHGIVKQSLYFLFLFCSLVTQNKGQENKVICMQGESDGKKIIFSAIVLQLPLQLYVQVD